MIHYYPLLLWTSFILGFLFFITIRFQPFLGHWCIKGASTLLLGLFVYYSLSNTTAILLLCAFVFSSVGDVFLGINQDKYFVHGLSAFLVAHIFYIIVFAASVPLLSSLSVIKYIFIAILLLFGALMYSLLSNNLGSLKIPVFIYSGVLTCMGIAAICGDFTSPIVTIGAILFIISDTMISIEKFVRPFWGAKYLIWGNYYVGQLFIALGIVIPVMAVK